MPKDDHQLPPISTFISVSELPGQRTVHLLHGLPQIKENLVSLQRQYDILTSLFLNDSVAWWIAYEDLSRATSRLVILSWYTAGFQVRSTILHLHTFLSFSRLAGTQFGNCMTCLTIQIILVQFEQIVPFSLVHTCLSLFRTQCFSRLQSLHTSLFSYTQQSNHGLSPKRVGSIILVSKSNLRFHLFVSTHSCLPHSSTQNPH